MISRTVSRADFVDVINQLRLRQISSSNNISNIPISVLVIPAGLNIRRYSNEDLINEYGWKVQIVVEEEVYSFYLCLSVKVYKMIIS